MAERECRERTAFVRVQVEKTVKVWDASYTPKDGTFYHRGTGTLINDAGLVVTAEHVVRNAIFITIGLRRLSDDGKDIVRLRDIPMNIVATAPEKDIAFLSPRFPETLPKPMPILARPLAASEQLWQFGDTTYWTHGPFIKSGVDTQKLHGLLKADIVSDGGDSGGPLVTEKGELAGVLVRDDKFGTSPSYYVPIADALAVLNK